MGRAIDGSAVDKVLGEAVDNGAVPHVAAIVADRDGIIYEGGAGVAGQLRDVHADPDGLATELEARLEAHPLRAWLPRWERVSPLIEVPERR